MRLYHFTSMAQLPAIQEAGFLKTTESNGDLRRAHAMPDVVWLIDTPTLDGLDHGLGGSVVDKTMVRITVDVPRARVERWGRWATRHGVDGRVIAALMESAGGWRAAKHWWVTERRIDQRFWESITYMPTGQPISVGTK